MAFDISRLTDAVNKHLNSISDISQKAQQMSEEAAARAQFSVDLRDAINNNILSHMPESGSFPDYGKEIQDAVKQAVAPIASVKTSKANEATIAEADKSSASQNEASNKDAYSGFLDTEALQDLSKSKYFNVNLIQSALFDNKDGEEEDADKKAVTSSTTDAFGSGLTLSDLNENSLFAADLLKTYGKLQKSDVAGSVFGDFLL